MTLRPDAGGKDEGITGDALLEDRVDVGGVEGGGEGALKDGEEERRV